MSDAELQLTAAAMRAQVDRGERTARALVDAALATSDAVDPDGGTLNIFLGVDRAWSRAEADTLDGASV